MHELGIFAVAAFALVFGLYSRRIERGNLSPTIVFTLAGLVAGPAMLGWLDTGLGTLDTLGEWTLILLLFADASRISLPALRKEAGLPLRLLGIGMPLSIAVGAVGAKLLFPSWNWAEAALLGSILAPTDAALGQAVVSSKLVPIRVRQALNVESGLNDGIALPFVMVFAALAGAQGTGSHSAAHWLGFWTQQVGGGALAGMLAGGLGGAWIKARFTREGMSSSYERVGAIAVAVLAVAGAELIGGNAFIAAFVAGLVLGNVAPVYSCCIHEFLEAEGQLLMLVVFMLLGAVVAGPLLLESQLHWWFYAVASLTLVRMLPVALSMWGSGFRRSTVVFVGWFGPRGLASVLFALIVIEDRAVPHAHELVSVAMTTVLLSIVLHGLSARKGAQVFGQGLAVHADALEHQHVVVHPTRAGHEDWDIPPGP